MTVVCDVRVIMQDGEPWFVGKTVREKVEDEDKGVFDLSTPGGKQRVISINESGLYSLILYTA